MGVRDPRHILVGYLSNIIGLLIAMPAVKATETR